MTTALEAAPAVIRATSLGNSIRVEPLTCSIGAELGNVNLGAAAGAGIREHFHLHVVPRWIGDANFVSVVGETRVLPEELQVTYQRMKSEW